MTTTPIKFLRELPTGFCIRGKTSPDIIHWPVEMEPNALYIATYHNIRLRLDRSELAHHWEWSADRIEWNSF